MASRDDSFLDDWLPRLHPQTHSKRDYRRKCKSLSALEEGIDGCFEQDSNPAFRVHGFGTDDEDDEQQECLLSSVSHGASLGGLHPADDDSFEPCCQPSLGKERSHRSDRNSEQHDSVTSIDSYSTSMGNSVGELVSCSAQGQHPSLIPHRSQHYEYHDQHESNIYGDSCGTIESCMKPIEVGMRVNLWKLLHMNDDTETFKILFDLVLEWEDPCLRNVVSCITFKNGQKLRGIVRRDGSSLVVTCPGSCQTCNDCSARKRQYPLTAVYQIDTPDLKELKWSPIGKFSFDGVGPEQYLVEAPPEVMDGSIGKIRIFLKLIGEFKQELDFQHFPLDQHRLRVKITAGLPTDVICFKDLKQSSFRIQSDKGSAWEVTSEPSIMTDEDDRKGIFYTEVLGEGKRRREPHARAVIQLYLKRRAGFYIWNYVLAIFVLTLISCGNFAIPITDVPGRSSITVTLVLTAVSFKHMMSSRLPVKPYRTDLENYVLFSFVLLGIPSFEQVAFLWAWCEGVNRSNVTLGEGTSGHIIDDGYTCSEDVENLDRQWAQLLGIIWIAYNAWCCLLCLRRSSFWPRCRHVVRWSFPVVLCVIAVVWFLGAQYQWFGNSYSKYASGIPVFVGVSLAARNLCRMRCGRLFCAKGRAKE